MRKPGWVYILAGRTGTLYTGVASDLYRRVLEHREKIRSGFAAKYDCNRLVFYEESGDIERSIDRSGETNQRMDTGKKDSVDRRDES